jgi:hypothetical protein
MALSWRLGVSIVVVRYMVHATTLSVAWIIASDY